MDEDWADEDDQTPPEDAQELEQSPAETASAPEPENQLLFPNVEVFVRVHLSVIYARDVGPQATLRWADDWWRYPEVVSRLTAIWRAWEHLRLDPATGMSVWWRDHADPHMNIILSGTGPFKRSETKANGSQGVPLPCIPAPEGLFDD